MRWLLRLFEVLVGGVLVYSGLHHIANPYQFASATAAYDLVPLDWLQFLPFVLSALMICLGLCFVTALHVETARVIGLGLLLIFTAGQTFSWLTGKQISCGCFGYSDQPISLLSISIPAGCALVCLANILGNRPEYNKQRDIDELKPSP